MLTAPIMSVWLGLVMFFFMGVGCGLLWYATTSEPLPRYVYTGYSDKENGFLILSGKEWAGLARELELEHHILAGKHVLSKMGAELPVIEETAQCGSYLDDVRHGCWIVYRATAKSGYNNDAVCW